MTVGVGEVGLYIVDGRAVEQVSTLDDEHRADVFGLFYGDEAHRGKPDGVGPEG